MKRILLIFYLTLSLSSIYAYSAFAGGISDTEQVMEEINKLKAKIVDLERKIAQKEAAPEDVKTCKQTLNKLSEALGDISINIGATGIVQGVVGNDDGDNPIDGSYSVDIEFEAPVGEKGKAYLFLEAGEGTNVTDEVAGLTGTNADALGDDADVQVSELWYEHNFSYMNTKMQLTVGKIDIARFFDQNAVANDETTQFLADIFVNNIAVEWPETIGATYVPGARLTICPSSLIDINLGIFDANDDYEDIFNNLFSIGELVVKPKFFGLPGNYRFYGWHNNLRHVEYDDVAMFPPLGISIISEDDEESFGFGLSFDQQLCEKSGLILFCRYGYRDDDTAAEDGDIAMVYRDPDDLPAFFGIEHAWSVGFSLPGKCWDRPEDVFAVAVGSAILNEDYEDVLRFKGADPEDEYRIEAYYNYKINDKLYITPDIQYVTNLDGDEDNEDIVIFGLRTQLYF
ncbi:MAG: carbohydrate porin [Thermodesulfobacteriota bacterium]|nr:carbohydrate porin [Thermodesulfobacteriota bacterium]